MTRQTLELAMLLPREAECAACVEEVGRELGRLDGVDAVEADVVRGLLAVSYDEETLAPGELRTYARRAGAQAHCADHCPLAVHDHGRLDLLAPLPGEDGEDRRLLHVTGMDCGDCAVKLQSALRRERGVRSAEVNFGAATLAVTIDESETTLPEVFTAVKRLGYDTVERRNGAESAREAAGGAKAAQRSFWLREPRALLTLLSGAFVTAGFAAEVLAPPASPWLFGAAVVAGGAFVARAALFSLRARQVDMNVLMSLAVIGALAIGQWSEAALVSFLFGLGTVLQIATLERTRRAITGLMELAPKEVTVIQGGRESIVPVAEVAPGDVVLVRPGERAAVDGLVLEGLASADQAPITGESRLVSKAPGDQVFAGSIIEHGTLQVRAATAAADNTIAKIVHLVEEAQAQRAPAESIVDRFASRYTPVVIGLAAAVAFIPPLLGASFDTWFYRGLALLIISCPCALVISTPVSILAALGRATRDGVLVKGGVYLEQAAKIKAIALDKTGTLTEGRPRVTDIVTLNGCGAARMLQVAAALERSSEHPLARAIVAEAEAAAAGAVAAKATAAGAVTAGAADHAAELAACCTEAEVAGSAACCDAEVAGPEAGCACCDHEHAGLDGAHHESDRVLPDGMLDPEVTRFRAIPGTGVRGEVQGRLHFVGRPALLGEHAHDPALAEAVGRLEREGKSAVAVGDEHGALGVIAVSDPLRTGAAEAVAELRELGIEHIVMLTGDNPETAAVVAAQAGIHDVRAGLLPEDKVAAVAELRDRYGVVAMVGDGVNDAPALAAASLGFAMGAAGTDAALETADIALMGDDLAALPATIRLSRRTTRIIRQNIAFSIVVKGAFIILAPLGLISLWLAVFADMGTSLLVTANGLRLFRR